MTATTDNVLYGVHQIDIINLLATGADDPSAISYTIDNPQDVGIAAVYEDGARVVLRGGDDIVAVIEEDDKLTGFDVTFKVAELMPEVDATICGGVAGTNKWESPKDATEEAFPFEMTIYIENYTESDSKSTLDGYIKFSFPFCKGRRGSQDHAQQSFGSPSYTVKARKNESGSPVLPAMSYEKVTSIV